MTAYRLDQHAEPIVPDALNRQILVVEDEAAVRAMITDTLRDRGYTVLEAADGPSGLLKFLFWGYPG